MEGKLPGLRENTVRLLVDLESRQASRSRRRGCGWIGSSSDIALPNITLQRTAGSRCSPRGPLSVRVGQQ
jgi:hypothetical protein